MAIALVAMIGLNSCSKDCEHEFIEYDYSKVLVGTWTSFDAEYKEAMVIEEDGSFTVIGIMGGNLHEQKGTIKANNNKVTLTLDNGEKMEGRLELVAGESFSIVLNEELDFRLNYHYCKEDLTDKIIGMWVATEGPYMSIETFNEDGTALYTGFVPESEEMVLNYQTNYKVIGDLQFHSIAVDGQTKYIAHRLIYSPNSTTRLGDVMTWQVDENISFSRLRVKQELDLNGKTYDYSSAYVSNVKGADEDFTILDHTFNISKIDSNNFDMFLRSVLSCIELNDNTIEFRFINDGRESVFNDPITVEGNKVTVDMSAENPALRKVVMYMFQDADDSQLHIYMPTKSFINYFANLQIPTLKAEGKLDTNDAAAVEKVFADMAARVESINVSFVFKARK